MIVIEAARTTVIGEVVMTATEEAVMIVIVEAVAMTEIEGMTETVAVVMTEIVEAVAMIEIEGMTATAAAAMIETEIEEETIADSLSQYQIINRANRYIRLALSFF